MDLVDNQQIDLRGILAQRQLRAGFDFDGYGILVDGIGHIRLVVHNFQRDIIGQHIGHG